MKHIYRSVFIIIYSLIGINNLKGPQSLFIFIFVLMLSLVSERLHTVLHNSVLSYVLFWYLYTSWYCFSFLVSEWTLYIVVWVKVKTNHWMYHKGRRKWIRKTKGNYFFHSLWDYFWILWISVSYHILSPKTSY